MRSSLSVFVFKIYSLKTPYQRSTSLIQPDYFRVEDYTTLYKSRGIANVISLGLEEVAAN